MLSTFFALRITQAWICSTISRKDFLKKPGPPELAAGVYRSAISQDVAKRLSQKS